jgi:hypothetical protein
MTDTTHLLRCKRCGCYAVAWKQTKTGKWYLSCKTFSPVGDLPASYFAKMDRRPHVCSMHDHHSEGAERHDATYEEAHR